MPEATTQDRTSAFRRKPVAFAPVPWSGRLDSSELSRPGGLLIAALMQCAAERELSLSEMASAMGVSYWNLSQLRIGFRPIAALDEDLAEACATFLDLPRQTVEMLAGLLEPADILASADATVEDILHARQLLDTEPADLVLTPPTNRARPLQGLAVDALADLHRNHGESPIVREMLRNELCCRPMSKTEQLRAALAALDAPQSSQTAPQEKVPLPVILRCAQCEKRLRIPHLDEPGEVRCPSCQAEYAVHWQAFTCLVQRIDAPQSDTENDADADDSPDRGSGIPSDDPWAILGLAAGSPWDAVERARRSLLQQYHPDRLGQVSPLVHKLAEDAFKRVKYAYEDLKSRR